VEHEADRSDGRFKDVGSGLDATEMGEGDGDADGAMAAHAKISGVVEEDDSSDAGWIDGLNQESANQHVGTTRLAKDGAPVEVVMAAEAVKALAGRAGAEIRPAGENAPGWFSRGMRIDDIQAKRYLRIGHGCLQTVYSGG